MNLIEINQDKSFAPEGDWEYERVFDNTEPELYNYVYYCINGNIEKTRIINYKYQYKNKPLITK